MNLLNFKRPGTEFSIYELTQLTHFEMGSLIPYQFVL